LLDWLGVALGGSGDPLVDILIDDAVEDGAIGEARLIGRRERVSPAIAALINGAASHALDFDDGCASHAAAITAQLSDISGNGDD